MLQAFVGSRAPRFVTQVTSGFLWQKHELKWLAVQLLFFFISEILNSAFF